MDSKSEMTDALELLKWQLELGVDENVGLLAHCVGRETATAAELKFSRKFSYRQS